MWDFFQLPLSLILLGLSNFPNPEHLWECPQHRPGDKSPFFPTTRIIMVWGQPCTSPKPSTRSIFLSRSASSNTKGLPMCFPKPFLPPDTPAPAAAPSVHQPFSGCHSHTPNSLPLFFYSLPSSIYNNYNAFISLHRDHSPGFWFIAPF